VDVLLDLDVRYNLAHLLSGRRRLEEVLVRLDNGLFVLPGATGIDYLANLEGSERKRFIELLERLSMRFDYMIFDTGAGISKNTTDFLTAADDVIIVTTPEPTAIIDAYALIRMISNSEDCANIYILINMARDKEEAQRTLDALYGTANKFLNVYVGRLGYILYDRVVAESVRQKRPFLVKYPSGHPSLVLRKIAARLCAKEEGVQIPREGLIKRLFGVFFGPKRF
jgi:flagellar biosynthesis protein FlhG